MNILQSTGTNLLTAAAAGSAVLLYGNDKANFLSNEAFDTVLTIIGGIGAAGVVTKSIGDYIFYKSSQLNPTDDSISSVEISISSKKFAWTAVIATTTAIFYSAISHGAIFSFSEPVMPYVHAVMAGSMFALLIDGIALKYFKHYTGMNLFPLRPRS